MASTEHREFTRVRTLIPVDIEAAGVVHQGTTRDVSLKGMFAAVACILPAGAPITATLFLDGRGGAVQVRARGAVVRALDAGLALRFDELLELESYEHLRNLVLYNAEDPRKAAAEFGSHCGLKAVDPEQPPPDA